MTFEISDYSEFQGVVHPVAANAVIIRAHNGWRADNFFAANRAAAHAAGCPVVGLYQYLVQSVDAATQARALIATVGTLAANEFLICDLEEGAGDQQPRWQAWNAVVVGRFGRMAWLYSGLAFAAAHDLHPDWVAAYQALEPGTPTPHKLWQNTDAYPFPWGKTDGSVYDGTLAQFLVACGVTTTAPTPAAPTPPAVPVTVSVPPFPGLTQNGSTGPAVLEVQRRLAARGWQIATDGDFGPATLAVVKAFQAEFHLAVDGIVGPQTWAALWTMPVSP